MVRAVMVLRKWLPPVIWMALIFGGSTDVLSGEHTSRFVLPFLRRNEAAVRLGRE